jgi:hypothetical protein
MSSSKLELAEKYEKELLDALHPYWCYNVDLLLVSLVVGLSCLISGDDSTPLVRWFSS